MVTALLIALYLIGYALSYYSLRRIIKQRQGRDWFVIERFVVILLSILSWLMILAFVNFVFATLVFNVNPDKEVKW
jgi:uncharacterized membrane-anchored protein